MQVRIVLPERIHLSLGIDTEPENASMYPRIYGFHLYHLFRWQPWGAFEEPSYKHRSYVLPGQASLLPIMHENYIDCGYGLPSQHKELSLIHISEPTRLGM